jgi:shikimate dehydrogenase
MCLVGLMQLHANVGELLERARRNGYHGLNVTHPCKRDVVEHHDAHAALQLGVREVVLVDVDEHRCAALAERLGATTGDLDELRDADGLIHATPTGMAAHPGLPLPETLLRPALWVAEVVYRALETELLRHARELGCRTLDGGGMAVMQAAGAFELFIGVAPDRERMLRHFAELPEAVGV